MVYKAHSADILFALRYLSGVTDPWGAGIYADLEEDLLDALIHEAGNIAEEVIAPLNAVGDREGARFNAGTVSLPKGWKEAYDAWSAAGWNGIKAQEAFGGQALPALVWAATTEFWNTANMAFGINPVLTQGAIEALEHHATDAIKAVYLPHLVSGEWTGTMNLTEPQAGSDLAAVATRAERQPDGTYRIFGQKIFITYGEHELTGNIVHLVLARLSDAPAGTKGISLFLVPKFLVDEQGQTGARNDVVCAGIEHKLGIHASPTCTMVFGEKEGAVGYLVGEENRGLACMFTMMNSARLAVGLQGVGIAERAFQQGQAYAASRMQGGQAIAQYPDVKRMLLSMKSLVWGARAMCYQTAAALDSSQRADSAEERQKALDLASLLTPLAKAFATDVGSMVASLNIQIHGGMGYIEETGAAQHYRDARIASIYEGTNGIQAIDLVMRKINQAESFTVRKHIHELTRIPFELAAANHQKWDVIALRLAHSTRQLEEITDWFLSPDRRDAEKLASATPYLRFYALTAAGCALAKAALVSEDVEAFRIARFFVNHHVAGASGLADVILEGCDSVLDKDV